MNLQLVSPFIKCPYSCPFCCASFETYPLLFKNLYLENKSLYFKKLINTISSHNIRTVVITGDTEPTLFVTWINDCVKMIREKTSVKIELQTKNSKYENDNIDIIAYSISNEKDINNINKQNVNKKD